MLVVGDVILDEYLIGRAERMSREAPIPVLEFQRRDQILGGGTNPAANMAALGAQVTQIGVVGADSNAEVVRTLLDAHSITDRLITDPNRPTTVKLRIMATMGLRFPQQVARIDTLRRDPIPDSIAKQVIAAIIDQAPQSACITASDYLSGLITPGVADAIRSAGQQHGSITCADAQGDFSKYRGYDVIKCNAEEAARYVGIRLDSDDQFAQAGSRIMSDLDLHRGMLITRGAAGMTVIERDQGSVRLPAQHVEDVYDTVGAGDTVLAVVGLGLAIGLPLAECARIANIAAGIVIRKVGNYTPSPAELIAELAEQT